MKFRNRKEKQPAKEGEDQKRSIRTYHWVYRKWPKIARKGTWYLMAFELAGIVPALVLFGISQPDLFRTDMWQIGWENRLNSNPAIILYAYANHRPLPKIAFVWTRTLTDFNVAISVISLFFLLSKLTAMIMKAWFPILATFINLCMVVLYAVSTYGQIGPDYVDPRYPAPAAWYFRYGCDMAKPWGKYKACKIAQGCLVPTLYLLVVYLCSLGFAAYAMVPNKINDVSDEDDDDFQPTYSEQKEEGGGWEMHSMKGPLSPRMTPYTPRTQAFHTLDRQLPLRSQQARFG